MNKNTFAEAARIQAAQLPADSESRAILEYLSGYAVGWRNAKPWSIMAEALKALGFYQVSKSRFQQTLLKKSRSNKSDIFIGSTDADPAGFFLIETPDDVAVALEFYDRRIEATQKNRSRLAELSVLAFGK